MLFSLFLVILGLGLLYGGGEAIVRGSAAIARKCGLPRLMIGLLIIGFGTSMPEMLVSISAALSGLPGIALGNVVGSNIANVLLVIGAAAVLVPISTWGAYARRGAAVAFIATIMLYLMTFGTELNTAHGVLMLGTLAGWLGVSYVFLMRAPQAAAEDTSDLDRLDTLIANHILAAALIALIGIALLSLGAEILIKGAAAIAQNIGISDTIIGLSLVAFGTSVPELAAAIVASLRRESDLIIGNIIGSNIFNILAVLGVTALIHPMAIDARLNTFDLPLVFATSLGLFLVLMRRRIGRRIGAAALMLYLCYMVMLAMQAGG